MAETVAIRLLEVLLCNLKPILRCLALRSSDMDRYRYLMERVWLSDIRADAIFQRTFNGLYMVRRGAAWRADFYELFEAQKRSANVSFEPIIRELHRRTGRIEASFSSKLLATINSKMPVYDSWVRINMGLRNRTGAGSTRIPILCEDYAQIMSVYGTIIDHPIYFRLRDGFDIALPNLRDLSDVKKIDFLLWQYRSSTS